MSSTSLPSTNNQSALGSNSLIHLSAGSKNISRAGVETMMSNIESEAKNVSHDVDMLISEVSKSLSTISAISVANIQTQNDSLNQLSNTIGNAVHNMFYLISHCEEINKSMNSVVLLKEKVEKLKTLLSALEENVAAFL